MIPKLFEDLPAEMKKPAVRPYYDALSKHRFSLCVKRCFDILASFLLIVILSPLIIGISVAVKLSSPGSVFFRQIRISKYGREFKIFKFRSMVENADKMGPLVTTDNDDRITGIGKFLRKTHLDEIPQLFNVFVGDMSFVGTRPEVKKYVDKYTDEMLATLLLPAGITSEASITYKDEAQLISNSTNADETYINVVLPEKMKLNLKYMTEFSLLKDISIMLRTFFLLFRR